MKIKFTVRYKGKEISAIKKIPNKDHLAVQLASRKIVFKDKTKYDRKQKHKKDY